MLKAFKNLTSLFKIQEEFNFAKKSFLFKNTENVFFKAYSKMQTYKLQNCFFTFRVPIRIKELIWTPSITLYPRQWERFFFDVSKETEPTANDNQGQKFAFYSAPGTSRRKKENEKILLSFFLCVLVYVCVCLMSQLEPRFHLEM